MSLPGNRREDLSRYRMDIAEETMDAAQICMDAKHYKDYWGKKIGEIVVKD